MLCLLNNFNSSRICRNHKALPQIAFKRSVLEFHLFWHILLCVHEWKVCVLVCYIVIVLLGFTTSFQTKCTLKLQSFTAELQTGVQYYSRIMYSAPHPQHTLRVMTCSNWQMLLAEKLENKNGKPTQAYLSTLSEMFFNRIGSLWVDNLPALLWVDLVKCLSLWTWVFSPNLPLLAKILFSLAC